MNYTLHQLQIFVQVVQTKSVTKAAKKLHMTQPAVSIQLKNLQNQFDIPLTQVSGKRLYITDFGKEVAEMAARVIHEAEAINYKTRAYKGLLTGKLKISTASTGKYLIPYFLSGFVNNHPGIDLVLDVTNRASVIKSLRKNEIDFGITFIPPDNLAVEEEILLENKLYLVGNYKERPANARPIYRERGSYTRIFMEEYFQEEGGSNRKHIELTSNEAVKQAVLAGLGYSLLPLIGIRNELMKKELHILPMGELPIRTDWRLTWLKNQKLSPVAQAYLDFLRSEKDHILQQHFQWYLEYD